MFVIETITVVVSIMVLILSLKILRKATRNTSIEALFVPKPASMIQLNMSGGFLLVLTVTAPLCALTIGGDTLPWDHPLVLSLLAVTPCLIACLYYHEKYVAKNPTIPIDIVSQLPVIRVLISVFGVIFALNIVGYESLLEGQILTSTLR